MSAAEHRRNVSQKPSFWSKLVRMELTAFEEALVADAAAATKCDPMKEELGPWWWIYDRGSGLTPPHASSRRAGYGD